MELPPLGPYVYLQTLKDIDKSYAERALDYSTFDLNKNYSNNFNNEKQHEIQPILNAVIQLENMAAAEAIKEQYAINSYRKKITNYLTSETKQNPIPPELKKNLTLQLENIKKMDINSYMNNENNFINSLNITIQNIHSYKRRLSEISVLKKNTEEIKQGYEQGAQSHLAKFLLNRKSRSTVTDNDKIRDRALNKLIKTEIKKLGLKFPQLESELTSVFFIDFTGWLANSAAYISYESLSPSEMLILFNQYASQNQNKLTETHLYRMAREAQNNNTQFKKLLEDMQSTLKSTFLTEQEYKQYKEFVESKKGEEKPPGIKIHDIDYSFKQINDLLETYEKNPSKAKKKYTFTLETKTSQGNFYERMSTILKNSIDVRGNVAADLILPIGTVTFTAQQQEQQKELMSLADDMGEIITTHFEKTKQASIDNFNQMVDSQSALHERLQKRLDTSEQNIQKISNIIGEKFFIAHETTKLYRSAESKKSNRVIEEFHGRKMKVMMALAKLYASTNLSENMINHNELITFLINIHKDTLAQEHNINPLETYLSIFAGLLMFDDIKEIADVSAKKIINDLNGSTINQLHVYNLGGVYYPLSVILNNLIIQLKNGINDINSIDYSKTAIVKIHPPNKIAEHKDGTLASWKALANTTIHNTELQVYFLKGFNEYIKDLFQPSI